MKINITDKDVGINYVATLLRKLSFIWNLNGRTIPNCEIHFQCTELDPVCALILYKFFEYSMKNKCILNPSANLPQLLSMTQKYGLEGLFKKLINKRDADVLYKQLKPYEKDGFFIAPHPINRSVFKSKVELEKKYTDFIANYYQSVCPELIQYFKTCICEIASNFLYHALDDDNSILMAQGDQNQIEIVCVDNSKGIISTIDPETKNPRSIIKKAFTKGFSSKKDNNHCGTGLWYIEKICKFLNGIFRVYSEGYSYLCRTDKVSVTKVPYWYGTIFYLKLQVADHNKIDRFFDNEVKKSNLGLIVK